MPNDIVITIRFKNLLISTNHDLSMISDVVLKQNLKRS